jgi:hypothetical protein
MPTVQRVFHCNTGGGEEGERLVKVKEVIEYLSQLEPDLDVKIQDGIGTHRTINDIQTWVSMYPNDDTKENETYILFDI